MKKSRRLGQHHLLDKNLIETFIDKAEISRDDIVFELGTGYGSLTELLCQRAKKVVSCELDPYLHYQASSKLLRFNNLKLIRDDGFKINKKFDVFISNLPFSESSRFIQWSLTRNFRRAVISVQKEFAEKLLAKPGERMYKAISVIAQARFQIEPAGDIPNTAFYPVPPVSSRILIFRPKLNRKVDSNTILWLKKLFSFRGRKLSTALNRFSKKGDYQFDQVICGKGRLLADRRIEDLTVTEAIDIVDNLSRLKNKRMESVSVK